MIPFVDLKTQYRSIQTEIEEAIRSVLETGEYILGTEVKNFESEFAQYCGAAEAIAVNSGTSALHLAMLAAGVGPGDEVITVPCTFTATVAAIRYTGARPVFVDIKPETYTIDPEQVERAITSRTKAILPVHLYGQMADMNPILSIARQHGLVVVEDAAQAHGAESEGRRAGSLGDLGCFSFYPSKNLGAYGEAGAIVTSNPEFARTARMLRDWGQSGRHQHVLRGFNYRMEGFQGAILRVKLRHLPAWIEARQKHGSQYSAWLEEAGFQAPQVRPGSTHVYHVYAMRVPDRAAFQELLTAQGIQTGIHYPVPVHLQEAHRDLGYAPGDFPHSEAVAAEEMSLPMFPELTEAQVRAVVDGLITARRSLYPAQHAWPGELVKSGVDAGIRETAVTEEVITRR
ncbi:MAG: DegT/DnrJ/EryC1/StrS family aminotransferase [Bryobacterales bacterium]|nr:DegT/DnrJ/EryC1/StrS family aminotransferase [Bryobacterales bacterium]